MLISAVTPTCNRPEAMRLAGKWMARQTRQPDQWVIAGDSRLPLHRRRFMDRYIRFAPLCAMSFRREFVPDVIAVATSMNPCLELMLWDRAKALGASMLHTDPTVVGMKGMPGPANVSSIDDAGKKWVDDPHLERFGAWLGDDAPTYAPFVDAEVSA